MFSKLKRAAIVDKTGNNAHAQSVICSSGRFLTQMRMLRVLFVRSYFQVTNRVTIII